MQSLVSPHLQQGGTGGCGRRPKPCWNPEEMKSHPLNPLNFLLKGSLSSLILRWSFPRDGCNRLILSSCPHPCSPVARRPAAEMHLPGAIRPASATFRGAIKNSPRPPAAVFLAPGPGGYRLADSSSPSAPISGTL